MGKDNTQQTGRLNELKKLMLDCQDERQFESYYNELAALHKKMLRVPVELEIPCSEVLETVDLGACKISRTKRGYLLEAKGGMYTFVEWRMNSVCALFYTYFRLYNKEDKTDEETALFDAFQTAILYCFQALIFASLSEEILFTIPLGILKEFNRYCEEKYINGKEPERTETDYKEDAEFEQQSDSLDYIMDSSTKGDISDKG